MNQEVGKVLGTLDAEPLGYWVAVPADEILQLDEVVVATRPLSNGRVVRSFGIVDTIRVKFTKAYHYFGWRGMRNKPGNTGDLVKLK